MSETSENLVYNGVLWVANVKPKIYRTFYRHETSPIIRCVSPATRRLSTCQTRFYMLGLTTSANWSRIGCCRTIRIHLTLRHGFRIKCRKAVRNRYPSMTQTGCWFGRFRSEFNLQVSTIAADVPPIGMAETAPVN